MFPFCPLYIYHVTVAVGNNGVQSQISNKDWNRPIQKLKTKDDVTLSAM